ncbi:MAG: hypothetical protein ACK5YQ_15385 [Betaproteobacteria bacterium]|jgi:hypothetical protein
MNRRGLSWLLALFAFAWLGGCATAQSSSRVGDRLSRLVGKPVDEALAAYGSPSCGSIEGNDRPMLWLYRWEPQGGTVGPPARQRPLRARHALLSYGRDTAGWVAHRVHIGVE